MNYLTNILTYLQLILLVTSHTYSALLFRNQGVKANRYGWRALIRLPEVNFPQNVTLRMCIGCIEP